MNRSNLHILGITINHGCEPAIRKNLKTDKVYPFIRSFKNFNSQTPSYPLSEPESELPIFFYQDEDSKFDINISAVVGPNGSGKSSLIDILIRLLNNVSYLIAEESNPTHNFLPIIGLRATLYYSLGNTLYRLIQLDPENIDESSCINIKLQKLENKRWVDLPLNKKNLGSLFFYAISLNYSIHAFNPADYQEQTGDLTNKSKYNSHWLKACFHKNDGYQAPLVLNPKRDNGNIDINIENHLAKSRLISLLFKSKNLKGSSFTYINEHTHIHSISISLDEKSVIKKLDKVWGIWRDQSYDFSDEKMQFISDTIVDYWSSKYNFKRVGDNDKLYDTALKYLLYKTLNIVITYNAFDNFAALTPQYKASIGEKWKAEIETLLNEIDKEPSHITFRLRQTLAFLECRQYEVDYTNNFKVYEISEFSDILNNIEENKHWEMAELAPPAIFKTDILIQNDTTRDIYPISQISSGERQLAYVISTIIYHLRNLDSVQDGRRIKYKHVAIILDEIELYFHPGYQRRFIFHLIEALKSVSLPDITSLHFVIITHSPFILSDIPKSNVLFLKDALPDYEMQENTFASNIHSILRNGFFMEDGTMGYFANRKVNDLFRRLHAYELSADLKREILLVSEPVLRTQLLKMYHELDDNRNDQSIDLLKAEIESLKLEIKALKNDTDKEG